MTRSAKPPRAQATPRPSAIDLPRLDLGLLALFVGQRMNDCVLAELHARGHASVRISHGYVIQHLIDQERSVSELGKRMAVSQQAASKVARELLQLGYIEERDGSDARVRKLGLSARGRELIDLSRSLRAKLELRLLAGTGAADLSSTRRVLETMLERAGGLAAVRRRAVPEPGVKKAGGKA